MATDSTTSSPKQSSKSDETIEIEFDGNTVLCRVCGDRASGFHYGVHACEGCKGFFRRSIQQKIQYRPCLKNQLCMITRVNRNRCQYCRLKKCIAVGMSRDAVRFGRVPKREKAKIMEQMQKVNIQCHGSVLEAILTSESELRRQIVEAHMKTCEFTKADFEQFYQQAWSHPEIVNCPSHMACPLHPFPDSHVDAHKWDRFADCFMPAIRNVVSFAKCIPGFSVLSQEDQVTLLKAGTFEVLLVHLACLFDSKNNTMLFTNGKIFQRTSLSFSTGAGYLLDSVFDFAERFNELNLTDDEVALFSALVIISADRPGLRGADLVEKLQTSITRGLQLQMKVNHHDDQSIFAKLLVKVSELRMLNTVHSEKLLGLSAPSVESSPEVFSTGSGVSPESRSRQFYYGGGCRDLDNRPVGAPFSFKNRMKDEDLEPRPEVIDLRGETSSFINAASRWPGGCTRAEEVDPGRDGAFKPKTGREDYSGCLARNSLPSRSSGENGWVSSEVTNHSAVSSSTNSSLTAHLSGSSIVAHQVMMKTVQQELILTTPVGTFHRMPLNLWANAATTAATAATAASTYGQREGVSCMEVDSENDEERRPNQQPWNMADESDSSKDPLVLGKSVITKMNKVMRTWSEETSNSKLSCSSCCSDGSVNVESLPVRSVRVSREQLEEPSLTRGSPQFQILSRDKDSECSMSMVDLPAQKTGLSGSSLYAPDSTMQKLRIGNILGHCTATSKGIGDAEQQRHYFNAGDQLSNRTEVLGTSCPSLGTPRICAKPFKSSFLHSSVKNPVREARVEVDSDSAQRSSRPSSSFTAENLLRPYDHSTRNKKSDREAHLTTKATLKERLLKRIDSRDNVNAMDSVGRANGGGSGGSGNGGGALQSFFGVDSTVPSTDAVNAAFPLQFLTDYPHFYPLGFPTGFHPGILYNHLALQHLHSIQQQQQQHQQQFQVHAQLNQAMQHSSRTTKTIEASNGTSSSTESPLVQSNSSEHLSLDGSSECEDIKHLKTPAEYLSRQSSFLLKSEIS